MGKHLVTLTDKAIKLEPDGTFRVTIDSKPANGRANHMQVQPGLLLFAARDSRSDWAQNASTLSLRRVSGPGLTRATNDRKSVVSGKSVSVGVEPGGRRII